MGSLAKIPGGRVGGLSCYWLLCVHASILLPRFPPRGLVIIILEKYVGLRDRFLCLSLLL